MVYLRVLFKGLDAAHESHLLWCCCQKDHFQLQRNTTTVNKKTAQSINVPLSSMIAAFGRFGADEEELENVAPKAKIHWKTT